tara:strand:+ start:402 stop:662 length:261 start_codon:yes stop_codon:yes gene_type:complete
MGVGGIEIFERFSKEQPHTKYIEPFETERKLAYSEIIVGELTVLRRCLFAKAPEKNKLRAGWTAILAGYNRFRQSLLWPADIDAIK